MMSNAGTNERHSMQEIGAVSGREGGVGVLVRSVPGGLLFIDRSYLSRGEASGLGKPVELCCDLLGHLPSFWWVDWGQNP